MGSKPFNYVFAKLQVKIERNFSQNFLLCYQKRISPVDIFIIVQLSANDFRVRTNGGKQQHYKKFKQNRYFNIINIAECTHAKLAVLGALTKFEVRNFPFPPGMRRRSDVSFKSHIG